jgi:hypothetical protein
MFANDRDLLAIDPNVFRDCGVAGQRLVKGTGDVSATTLTLTAQDNDFEAAGVTAGHVVLVDGAAYEVLERLTATTAMVSRLRASTLDDPIPPSPTTGKPVEVWTFWPQIGIVHGQVLRMLGIDPEDPPAPGQVTEQSITNPKSFAHVESLGALYHIYSAAALTMPGGAGGWASPIWSRAQMYRERFEAARQLSAARIDADGDGVPDATRRLSVLWSARA